MASATPGNVLSGLDIHAPSLTATQARSWSRRFLSVFAQTPLPPALEVAALTLIGLLLAGVAPRVATVSMVLLVAFASYGIDRFVDRAAERGHVRGQGGLVLTSTGLFAIAVAIAWSLAGPALAAVALAFPLSVVAYCVPWLDGVGWLGQRGIRRVKDIPYTKNLYTTVCVTASMVWAGAVSGAPMSGRVAAAAAVVFLMELVNVVACDLGDLDSDLRDGVPTFPVLFGRERTARVLTVGAWVWAVALVVGFAAGVFPTSALWGAASVIATHAYLQRLARGGDVALFADVVPDLAVVLTGAMMLGGKVLGGG
jgi:4-hydroxybenzoate polyprenyltransferase